MPIRSLLPVVAVLFTRYLGCPLKGANEYTKLRAAPGKSTAALGRGRGNVNRGTLASPTLFGERYEFWHGMPEAEAGRT